MRLDGRARRVAWARVAVVMAATAVAVSACSGNASSRSTSPTGSGVGAGTFVLATTSEPDTLNPVLGDGSDGASLIFDGLLARDSHNELVPALARTPC